MAELYFVLGLVTGAAVAGVFLLIAEGRKK